MSLASSVTGMVPGMQSLALLGHNIGEVEFGLNGKKKKRNGKRMVKLGMTNLMAIPMIKVTAQQAALVP